MIGTAAAQRYRWISLVEPLFAIGLVFAAWNNGTLFAALEPTEVAGLTLALVLGAALAGAVLGAAGLLLPRGRIDRGVEIGTLAGAALAVGFGLAL